MIKDSVSAINIVKINLFTIYMFSLIHPSFVVLDSWALSWFKLIFHITMYLNASIHLFQSKPFVFKLTKVFSIRFVSNHSTGLMPRLCQKNCVISAQFLWEIQLEETNGSLCSACFLRLFPTRLRSMKSMVAPSLSTKDIWLSSLLIIIAPSSTTGHHFLFCKVALQLDLPGK